MVAHALNTLLWFAALWAIIFHSPIYADEKATLSSRLLQIADVRGPSQEFESVIKEAVHSTEVQHRTDAAVLLGSTWFPTEYSEYIWSLMTDSDQGVQEAAAHAVADIATSPNISPTQLRGFHAYFTSSLSGVIPLIKTKTIDKSRRDLTLISAEIIAISQIQMNLDIISGRQSENWQQEVVNSLQTTLLHQASEQPKNSLALVVAYKGLHGTLNFPPAIASSIRQLAGSLTELTNPAILAGLDLICNDWHSSNAASMQETSIIAIAKHISSVQKAFDGQSPNLEEVRQFVQFRQRIQGAWDQFRIDISNIQSQFEKGKK